MSETLKRGDIGHNVYRLQRRLEIFATGYFDTRTEKAVKQFQKDHKPAKLKVDGEVGSNTLKALDMTLTDWSIPFHPSKLWLSLALGELDALGVARKESGEKGDTRPGKDNPRILEYLRTTTYAARLSDEVPWCSAFANWVMKKSGHEGTNHALAKSWLEWKYGIPVTNPEVGDIIIIRTVAAEEAEKNDDKLSEQKTKELRMKGYHVGFYISSSPGKVRIFGGNQSNMVKETDFNLLTGNKPQIIKGYRRPKSQGSTALLKIGNAKGGCTLKGYEGCLPLATFTTGLERATAMETGVAGRGPGVPRFETVSITRVGDGSAVSLLGLILKGGDGVDATVTSVSTNGHEHWKHEYRNVMMAGYAVSINEDGKITEGMMLSYSRVEVTCTPYDDGKACNPLRVAYDVSAAKLA